MNALNSILIEGNVVRDAVVKETPRGTLVCNFSIASNRYYRQGDDYEQETSFVEVETWAKHAEVCGKNCLKGRGIRVVGRLKQDRWTSPEGKNCSKVKIVAEHVEFKPQFKNKNVLNQELEETDSVDETDQVEDSVVHKAVKQEEPVPVF
ncbi:MAG TPA: single-stranded DNA-binding protein [Treponema sp.]|nr:single-stranded DNA-binding protein [Treponema sp.]